ncbi:MAG: hypothetical protein L0H63_15720 [Nitrococcus sp.]|nr:hypothetical protein [Nitrococcus sp.]
MDEAHLLAAFRYITLNPVEAKLVRDAADWHWSSNPAHLAGRDDVLVSVQPLLTRVDDVAQFLSDEANPVLEQALISDHSTGQPLMEDAQLRALEKDLQRRIRSTPRGWPGREMKGRGKSKIV